MFDNYVYHTQCDTDTINCFLVNKIPGKLNSCVHTCVTGTGSNKESTLHISDADSHCRDSSSRIQFCQAQACLHWWGSSGHNAARRLPIGRGSTVLVKSKRNRVTIAKWLLTALDTVACITIVQSYFLGMFVNLSLLPCAGLHLDTWWVTSKQDHQRWGYSTVERLERFEQR